MRLRCAGRPTSFGNPYAVAAHAQLAGGCRSLPVGVPLIRSEEIRRLPKDTQILLKTGMHPIKGKNIPYYTNRKWAADANPYRRDNPASVES